MISMQSIRAMIPRVLAIGVLLVMRNEIEVVAQTAANSRSDVHGKPSIADQRIAFVREQAARLRVQDAKSPTPYPLHDKLALRWSNPVSGVVDGGVFVWTNGQRPVVIGKIFVNERSATWCEALQSVTSDAAVPLVMHSDNRIVWQPNGPGIRFLDLDESAGKPSDNESARLTQMRVIARKIQVIGNWGTPPSDWQLRILTTPLYRYASEPDKVLDGAIFAYTQGGTNPEGISLIEAVTREKAESHWRIAVTRLTSFGVKATFNDQVIADLPRLTASPSDALFFGRSHQFGDYPFPITEPAKEKGTTK